MAVFVTREPFRGVEQIKYEQLLRDDPQFVRDADKDEFEAYLHRLSERYQERCCEIVESEDNRWKSKHPDKIGTGEHFARIERLRMDAEKIALQEMLEA